MAEVKMERSSLDVAAKKNQEGAKVVKAEVLPPTRTEPVAKAKVSKPSFGERFISTLGLENGRTVRDVLVWDVVVPTTKDLIYNIFNQGLSVFLYGNTGPAKGRPQQGRAGTSRVSYGDYYDKPYKAQNHRPSGQPQQQRSAQNGFDFSSIRWYDYYDENGRLVTGRAQAQSVLDEMLELIDTYDWCRVSDFLASAGVPEEDVHFTDHALGWDRLGTAGSERARDGGYYLVLPRPTRREGL